MKKRILSMIMVLCMMAIELVFLPVNGYAASQMNTYKSISAYRYDKIDGYVKFDPFLSVDSEKAEKDYDVVFWLIEKEDGTSVIQNDVSGKVLDINENQFELISSKNGLVAAGNEISGYEGSNYSYFSGSFDIYTVELEKILSGVVKYDRLYESNVALVQTSENKFIFFDESSKSILENLDYDKVEIPYNSSKRNSFIRVTNYGKYYWENKCGLFNSVGNLIIPIEYYEISIGNYYITAKGNEWKYYTLSGKQINMQNEDVECTGSNYEYFILKDDNEKKTLWNNEAEFICEIPSEVTHVSSVFEDNNLIAMSSNGYGMLDLSCKWIVNPQYTSMKRGDYNSTILKVDGKIRDEIRRVFKDYIVTKDSLYGIVDNNNRVLKEFTGEKIDTYYGAYKQNGSYFCFDEKGNIVKLTFGTGGDEVFQIAETGKYVICRGGRICSKEYDKVYKVGKHFMATQGTQNGIVDINDIVIVPFDEWEIECKSLDERYNETAYYQTHRADEGLYGVFSLDGKECLPCEYSGINSSPKMLNFSTGKYEYLSIDTTCKRYFVSKENKYGLIDDSFNIILKPEYDYIGEVCDNTAIVGKEQTFSSMDIWTNRAMFYGMVDLDGNEILPCEYYRIVNGISYVIVYDYDLIQCDCYWRGPIKPSRWCIADKKGKLTSSWKEMEVPPKYLINCLDVYNIAHYGFNENGYAVVSWTNMHESEYVYDHYYYRVIVDKNGDFISQPFWAGYVGNFSNTKYDEGTFQQYDTKYYHIRADDVVFNDKYLSWNFWNIGDKVRVTDSVSGLIDPITQKLDVLYSVWDDEYTGEYYYRWRLEKINKKSYWYVCNDSGSYDPYTKVIDDKGNVVIDGITTDIRRRYIKIDNEFTDNPIMKNSVSELIENYKNPTSVLNGKFNSSSESFVGTEVFDYYDNYFANSAYNYNPDLAKTSIRLAMSAFAVKDDGYSLQYKNARNMLNDMNFKEISWNDGYTEKPTTNSIGVIAGNKKIAFDDGDYTLIAVAIRGGGYEAEWGGNFNVGSGENHQGFQLARDQVLSFLTEYVREANISGNIKIWITGFSRAAATANLTAAYLNTHSLILNGTNTDLDKLIEVKPENIYAYCFETPAGTRDESRNDTKYSNIFSIVNQNDFVPMVAPEEWGFGRYGITYYLPSPKTHSNYRDLEITMYSYYDEYVKDEETTSKARTIGDFDNYKLAWSLEETYPNYGFYLKNQNSNQHMDDFLKSVISALASEFKSSAYYEDSLQDALVYFGTEIMGHKNSKAFLETFKKELLVRTNPASAVIDSYDALSKEQQIGILDATIRATFREFGIAVDNETIDNLDNLLYTLLTSRKIETLLGNLDILPTVHYPELCMAWLDSKRDNTQYVSETRRLCINCPVDLEVYDSNNNLVAAIRNNEVIDIDDSSIVAYVDENGQKVVYLPTDEEYRTEIIATDDGEVTYSVQEQNANTGATRVINYNNMTVKKDDTLTATAENLSVVEEAQYTLTSNTATVSEAEVIENAQPISVGVKAEGNGNVSGGGNLYKGEFAQVMATPLKNEKFLGWYNGETLISSETIYRFQVAEQITLTAKFTDNTCEILYLTDEEDVVVIDRILKGSTVTFPSMNQNPNYMILDIYTDAEYTTLADEDTTYSEDTMLYAKVLTKDDWVQFDEVNNKVIVYTPTAMSNVQVMVALYEGEKLTELKPNTVDLVVGKNELKNLITNIGTADTLKIFVWNGLSTLKPIFKNCVVDLK